MSKRRSFTLILAALLLVHPLFAIADESVDPHIMPNFYDFKVPNYLMPALHVAKQDYPKPYRNHCHTQQNMTTSSNNCTFGNANSKTTVVLFGDSHALSWFPAIEKLALYKNWKLISLTMSSCWPAQIPAWNPETFSLMENCTTWRKNTFAAITKLKPKYIFVAGTSGFATVDEVGNLVTGEARTALWKDGMKATLTELTGASKKIFYLADYPSTVTSPVDCLRTHKTVKSCVKPLYRAISMEWLQVEHDVATENGAIFIDGTEWICQTDPCSPVVDNYLVYRDAGHLTATFAKTLFSPLYQATKRYLI